MGGQRETLAGLSGLGDLVLTCTGTLSRNRHVGLELGRGRSLPEILGGMRMVAEGVRTTDAALALATRHGIELPIAAQMAEVLSGRRSPKAAVAELMLRPQREEAEPGAWPRSFHESKKVSRRPPARFARCWPTRPNRAARHGLFKRPGPRAGPGDTLDAVEEALIAADVGLPATERILTAIRNDRQGSIGERVGREVRRVLTDAGTPVEITSRPHVILIVGVNGTGKTTTVGKLANFYPVDGTLGADLRGRYVSRRGG